MNTILVGAAALNQIPIDWRGNTENCVSAIHSARNKGVQILCLPELCITGYGCEDLFYAPAVHQRALSALFEIAKSASGIVVTLGLPLVVSGKIYNAVALIVDCKVVGFVCKQHLAGDGVHYEPRWFKAWPAGAVSSLTIGGEEYPVGSLIFSLDGFRIGFEICEDAWVENRVGIELGKRGVDIILNPSASHFAFNKSTIRKNLALKGSALCSSTYIYANLLGNESGRVIFDGDTVIASNGKVVAEGERFSYQSIVLTTAFVAIEETKRPETLSQGVVSITPHRFIRSDDAPTKTSAKYLDAPIKELDFCKAVSLGVFDYMRKSKSHGFVVSLSGGVDSSAVSCLVRLMISCGIKELGLPEFLKKLSFIPNLGTLNLEKDVVKALLTCVYQKAGGSSVVTEQAAQLVADQLGADYFSIDISHLVAEYEQLIGNALKVSLSWQTHDIEKQNIQARVRSPSIWLIANIKKALLLTTSNRSEASVGYTTMDGDSSGGLAPLGGIDKAYLREWLEWLEINGESQFSVSFSSLKSVNSQEPTAELRPLATVQTDEGDLMPYVVLDCIERSAIRDKEMPVQVLSAVYKKFKDDYTYEQLKMWVKRFFTLWSRNQWKRERYAPSFHLDDLNVDPKTWCRFPILSSGFEEELEELEQSRLT